MSSAETLIQSCPACGTLVRSLSRGRAGPRADREGAAWPDQDRQAQRRREPGDRG